ncbi:hypothetical protein [Phenylobacterium sp.]|jgi:hypothetical protein|uniref:hypothetical protein n=1 Tax=Phenylobacterium sp. TaxID=1871053 RepID=UPI002E2FC305|nr:hypothetical protein [Phenylobacterium sp.]HEX2560260.1 hypothetical protein [Phenylobacterium sp.]
MTDFEQDTIELTTEQLEEMVDDAIDVLALALPEEAGDEYWRALRAEVERRAQEMLAEVDDEDAAEH